MGSSSVSPGSHLVLPATVCANMMNLPMLALEESGAKPNLIRKNLADQLQIPVQELTQPVTIDVLTGQASGTVSFISLKTQVFYFVISGNHHEKGEVFFVRLPYFSFYFGLHLTKVQSSNELGRNLNSELE